MSVASARRCAPERLGQQTARARATSAAVRFDHWRRWNSWSSASPPRSAGGPRRVARTSTPRRSVGLGSRSARPALSSRSISRVVSDARFSSPSATAPTGRPASGSSVRHSVHSATYCGVGEALAAGRSPPAGRATGWPAAARSRARPAPRAPPSTRVPARPLALVAMGRQPTLAGICDHGGCAAMESTEIVAGSGPGSRERPRAAVSRRPSPRSRRTARRRRATLSGSGASGGSCDRSSSPPKNRTNGRRCCVTGRGSSPSAPGSAASSASSTVRCVTGAVHVHAHLARQPEPGCAGGRAGRRGSRQRLHLDRQHGRQVAHDRRPGVAAVRPTRRPDRRSCRSTRRTGRARRRPWRRAARSRSSCSCGRPSVSGSHSLPPVRLR